MYALHAHVYINKETSKDKQRNRSISAFTDASHMSSFSLGVPLAVAPVARNSVYAEERWINIVLIV